MIPYGALAVEQDNKVSSTAGLEITVPESRVAFPADALPTASTVPAAQGGGAGGDGGISANGLMVIALVAAGVILGKVALDDSYDMAEAYPSGWYWDYTNYLQQPIFDSA